MFCYRIEKALLKDFAIEIKAVTTMDDIRRAFVFQPDGSANYYAITQAEEDVCLKFGSINE